MGVAVAVCVGMGVLVRVKVAVGVDVGGVEHPTGKKVNMIMTQNLTAVFMTPLLSSMWSGKIIHVDAFSLFLHHSYALLCDHFSDHAL